MDALLLDFNGVIVDDEPLHFASFRDVLGDAGIVLDEQSYAADYLGIDDRAAFRKALERHSLPAGAAELRRFIGRKAELYAALARRRLTVVPGVCDFIKGAARTARIAVVSGALRAEIEVGLEVAGVRGAVEVIVSAENVATAKPDPEGFRQALGQLSLRHGTSRWRAVIIEDSLPGLAAARAIGAGCVMLTTSHGAPALSAADRVWTSFDGHGPADLEPLWRPVDLA